jgi:hypothetical protein
MSDRLGQFFLGYSGVFAMTSLWSLAVGCAVAPILNKQHPAWIAPGPLIGAALLGLSFPFYSEFLLMVVLTTCVMYPAYRLATQGAETTRKRAAVCLALTAGAMGIRGLIPEGMSWLGWLLTPLLMFGTPIGLLLLIDPILKKGGAIAAALSGLLFFGAWGVWMARDHFLSGCEPMSAAPQNNALHQTGRGGAAVSLCRRPVVEARPAGEREC